MFQEILREISTSLSGVNAKEMASKIHDLDRWSSFDKYHETSQYCCEKMEEYGLEPEIISVPADGETKYGDWIMPMAWDAKEAELKVMATDSRGEIVLANYRDEPCSLIVWSAPTPPEGITAEVVLMEDGAKEEDYEGVDVRGKIIFTSKPANEVKVQAVKHGAVGIVSDHIPVYDYCRPYMEIPDAVSWVRFGPDYDYGGWGLKKGDLRSRGFVLSPRKGKLLRDLLAKEGKVVLRARIDARIYEGAIDLVMGRVPGRTKEEVLINGHLSEYGAIDDASGCGLAIEILRCVNELIGLGKLKRPKRGIRMLFTFECMGTMAAAVEQKRIFDKAIAGITLDCVGGNEGLCMCPLTLSRNPHAQSSYTDVLLKCIMEHLSESDPLLFRWKDTSYTSADNMISDPTIGVPCPLLLECPYKFYHNSTDTPDKLDEEKLRWIGRAAASYVYFIGNAGEKESRWLAQEVAAEARRAIVDAAQREITRLYEARTPKPDVEALSDFWRKLDYARMRYCMALDSTLRLVPRGKARTHGAYLTSLKNGVARLADLEYRRVSHACGVAAKKPGRGKTAYQRKASKIVPTRLVIGELRKTNVPQDDREEWDEMCKRNDVGGSVAHRAVLWADGKRNLAEITEFVEQETGAQNVRLIEFFEYLEKYGYVKLRRTDG